VRPSILLVGTLLASAAHAGEAARTLELQRPVEGVATVHIQAGVGEVEILASTQPVISVRVEISADSSSRRSRRQAEELDAAQLAVEERGDTLELQVRHQRRTKEWHESWFVLLPEHLARTIKLGVGDVRILDASGNVSVEVGVGEVRIEGNWAAYGRIAGNSGVGDVVLRSPAGRQRGTGFVGHQLRAEGPGAATIEVNTGVGDIDIRLR